MIVDAAADPGIDTAHRMRRLRRSGGLRRMLRETRLSPADFIYPVFVAHGRDLREPIPSMPGQARLSLDQLPREAADLRSLGVPAILLFGLPAAKDAVGSESYAPDGIVQQAVRTSQGRRSRPGRDHRRLPLRIHRSRPLRRPGRPRRSAQRRLRGAARAQRPGPGGSGRRYRRPFRHDGRPDRRGAAGAGPQPAAAIPSSSPTPPNSPPPSTDPSATPPIPRPPLATAAAISWTRPTGAKRCARSSAIWRKAPTWSWSSRLWPIWIWSGRRGSGVNAPLAAYNVSGEYAMVKAAAQQGWDRRRADRAGDAGRHPPRRRRPRSSPTTPKTPPAGWPAADD